MKLRIFTAAVFSLFYLSIFPTIYRPTYAQSPIRFIAWGDTKSDTNVLQNLSAQAKALNPSWTIYAGDLESSGFTSAGMNIWKAALNGGVNNGMYDITFPVRGNHDASNPSAWQGYFDLYATVQRIGATNYTFLDDNLTYSFDYGITRIIGIDVPGNVTQMTSSQISFFDQRLTDAENKGFAHAFFFWHGPFYSQANHCCPVPASALISVINKHPVVSAGFFGHEHILTYAQINSSRIPGITRDFVQIITGDAGAGPTSPTSGRYDYALDLKGGNSGGFALVEVSGNSFTVSFYKGGTATPQWSKTFTKSGLPPPSVSTTPPTSPTPPTTLDCRTNPARLTCFEAWRLAFTSGTFSADADMNGSGSVTLSDFEVWRRAYTGV